MHHHLLHIFRNTPSGREVFLQSLYFARQIGVTPKVFIPSANQFLMYFGSKVVTVDLDSEFLRFPETARGHAEGLLRGAGFEPNFYEPDSFTAGTIPVLPTDFAFMTCPRTISDLSTKIGLGYIGPKVRSITRVSTFPVLIPSQVHKEWKSISVFFGGSSNSLSALKLALRLKEKSGLPLNVFTQLENLPFEHYRDILKDNALFAPVEQPGVQWKCFGGGSLQENLYDVPHDSLIVIGAYGHGLTRRVLFGSKAELLQTVLPNNLLLVGPNCRTD